MLGQLLLKGVGRHHDQRAHGRHVERRRQCGAGGYPALELAVVVLRECRGRRRSGSACRESSSREAAVMRRSAIAWPYKNGLSVEPGWRSAVDASPPRLRCDVRGLTSRPRPAPRRWRCPAPARAPSSTWRPRKLAQLRCCMRLRGEALQGRTQGCCGWLPVRAMPPWSAAGHRHVPGRDALARRKVAPRPARPRQQVHALRAQCWACGPVCTGAPGFEHLAGTLGHLRRWLGIGRAHQGGGHGGLAVRPSPWAALPKSVLAQASMPTSSPRNGTRLR